MRYGIIGCGMIAQEHIRNLRLFPDVEVVAISDPVPDCIAMTKETLSRDDVRVYSDSIGLANDGGLDAVIISSPNYTHRKVLEPFFGTDIHILCEKPLATTIDDARWVRDRAAAHKGIFWTAMEYHAACG
jgi:myo-inositol 2-dehydrogenase / D-chiro-inositol 1-dehydrogenase